MRISLIRQRILSSPSGAPSIKVHIRKLELANLCLAQSAAVVIHSLVDALDVHVFGLGTGNRERHRLKGAYLGDNLQKKRQHPAAKAWLAVSVPPILLVLRPGKMVEELF